MKFSLILHLLFLLHNSKQSSSKINIVNAGYLNIYPYRYDWYEINKKRFFELQCDYLRKIVSDADAMTHFEEKKIVDSLEIRSCILTNISLQNIILKINIEITQIHTLKLSEVITSDARYNEDLYFKNLNIQELQLYSNKQASWERFDKNIYLILKSLPPGLPKLILKNSWVENWDNCQDLLELSVSEMHVELIPEGWFFNCTGLVSLSMIGIKEYKIREHIRAGIGKQTWKTIRSLTMQDCIFHRLPLDILMETRQIKYLDLSNNFLDDDSISDFSDLADSLKNLKFLNLSRNLFMSFGELLNLPSLSDLVLDINQLVNNPTCIQYGRQCLYVGHDNLQSLSLKDNSNEEVSFLLSGSGIAPLEYFPNLTFLNFALTGRDHDRVRKEWNAVAHEETIEFSSLLTFKKRNINLDLTGRNFREIKFNEEMYRSITELNGTKLGINLTIPSQGLDCDCKHYWLARALIEYPRFLSIPNLRCESRKEIIHEPFEKMNCVKVRDDSKMTVKKWNNSSSIHWHNTYNIDWKELMDVASLLPSLKSLNVSENIITSLYPAFLPDSLTDLDLRYNQISRLDSNETRILFAVPERRVWLSGNLFLCDCNNTQLLDALHRHRNQVEDFYNLTCIDSGKPLYTVSSFEACLLRNTIIVTSVLAFFFLIIALMLWRYRYHIQIYLHAHGLFISCISEEDMDADKPYDAFISYSHEDEEYVTQQLIPKLEGEPYHYRLCVHFRDWVVGEWIPAQIMRSVSLSKRVIIVLSRHFTVSMWGKLEFRYAMAGLSKNGRFRLIVLVLDDVLLAPLEAEMQGYLALNTYMRCDDPFFWERLYFAMPHRKTISSATRTASYATVDFQMETRT